MRTLDAGPTHGGRKHPAGTEYQAHGMYNHRADLPPSGVRQPHETISLQRGEGDQ
jgi:hypothetical protein